MTKSSEKIKLNLSEIFILISMTIIYSILFGYFNLIDNIYIRAIIAVFIFPALFKAMFRIDMDINIRKYISKFTRLWFDWIKWLILAGALTVIAQKTQDQLLTYLKDLTYLIILIYFGTNFLSAVHTVIIPIEEMLDSRLGFLANPKLEEDVVLIISLGLSMLALLFIGIVSRDWNTLLEDFVTKLPVK